MAAVPLAHPFAPVIPPPAPGHAAAARSTMTFDAAAARALARKSTDLLEVLSQAKQAIVQAAERGEFLATAPLPEVVEVRTGAAIDAPDFLVTLYREAGRTVLVDVVLELTRADYVVRPAWGPVSAAAGAMAGAAAEGRRGVAGLLLDWSIDRAAPKAGGPALRILPAAEAHALSRQARAPREWVDGVMGAVRKAAEASRFSCHLEDREPAASAQWPRRRALLEAAGFRLEVAAREQGSLVTIRW